MSGQSQAANLGGMLSQIGGALGSMGGAGDGLLGSIKNTFRPGVDPNDPASIRQAAEYQMRVGNTDQATLYTKQAELMAEKQKEAQKLNIAKATEAAKGRYRQAVMSGDVAAQKREEQILSKMGAQFGIKASDIMAGVQQEKRTSDLQGLQMKVAQEKEQAAKTAEQINQVTATVIDQYGVDSPQFQKLKEAPMLQQNRDIVQQIEARELRLLDEREKRAEHLQDLNTPPSIDYLKSMANDDRLDDPALAQEVERLEKQIQNKDAGKWGVGEKRKLEKDIANLERTASRQLLAIETAERSQRKVTETALRTAKGRQANESVAEWEVEGALEALSKRIRPAALLDFGAKNTDTQITADDVKKNPDILKEGDIGKTMFELAKEKALEAKQAPYDPLIQAYEAELGSSSSPSGNKTADDYL